MGNRRSTERRLNRTSRHRARMCGRGALLFVATLLHAAAATGADEEIVHSQRIGGLKAEIAALIVSGQAGGEVELAVTALPYPIVDSPKQGVSFWLEARGASLLPEEGLGRIELYVYAVTESGGVAGSLLETFPVADEARAGRLRAGGVRLSGDLRLEPGNYSLRVLVREAESGRLGAQLLSLRVPAFETGRSWLLQPTIAAAGESWISIVPTGGAATALGGARPTPRPVAGPGDEVTLVLPTYGAAIADSVEVSVGGEPRAGTVAARRPTPDGAGELVDLAVDVSDVDVGLHEVVVRTNDGALRSPPLYLVVAPGGLAAGSSWLDIGSGGEVVASEPATGESVPTRRRRRRRLDTRAESAAYLDVLRELANGDTERADELLEEFERRILREKSADALPELARLKLDIASRLAAVDAAALGPIAQLHSRAYDRYFANREFLLSTFARRAIMRLGAVYLGAESGVEPERAADLYSSLASELRSRNHLRLSQEAFGRALEAQPGHLTSLIGLATTYEQPGSYEEALPILRGLRRDHPSLAAPRLQLGIDQLHIGRRAGGVRELKSLIEMDGAPHWVLTVAYQELARSLMRRDRTEEAIELLNRAVERLPGDEQLRLLLAFAHDARNEPWTAREVLHGWVPPENPPRETARRRYASLSNVALPATLERLDRWDSENRSTLARALGEIATESTR